MKIARIKEIKNVGTFSDFRNGGEFGFEELTFIYGLNTYGKTTLADIFQSIKDNDPNLIQSRKTIPVNSSQQKIIVSIKENDSEKDLVYQNSSWGQNNFSQNLEVFGTDFIHKYLFTGLTIERPNKEEFTQFVLGEEGVEFAKKISQENKTLGDKRRGIKYKAPEYLKGRISESEYLEGKNNEEIERFLDLNTRGLDGDKIEQELLELKKQKDEEMGRLKEPQKILSMQDVDNFEMPEIDVSGCLNNINKTLQKDYSDINDEVIEQIEKHLEDTFEDKEGAESWIRQGLSKCKDHNNGRCVFCGQHLQDAQDLIRAYTNYFDEAYSNFISEIENDLSNNLRELKAIDFNFKDKVQSLQIRVLKYKDLIKGENFKTVLNKLSEQIEKLDEVSLATEKKRTVGEIEERTELKDKKPHLKVAEIDFSGFTKKVEDYKDVLQAIKDLISMIKKEVKEFKKQYENTEKIEKKIKDLNTNIKDLERKEARIKQDDYCEEYERELNEIWKLKEGIDKKREKLKDDQSEYLEKYFIKINELFKKLGSYNFSLEKTSEIRGYQPVYSLKVKYHGEKISSDNLEKVLSESDRRALALAVFWAKIELKDDSKKQNTVVILDDPVTSFDDNRIINSINLFKESLNTLGQIIILTHYPHFIKNFCERVKREDVTTKFFEIKQKNSTSYLSSTDRQTFIQSDYIRVFTKIYGFINKEHDNDIRSDLRPFLEDLYIPMMFANNVKKAEKNKEDISTLEKLIDMVIVDVEVKAKLHEFRKNLNPDSHIFTSSNDEDVRNFARDMMEYLYSFSFDNNKND